jgi:Leucine-rich repeat (LRR) protein
MGQTQSNSNKVNNDNSDVVELLPSSESAKQTPLDKAYKIIEEYKRDLAVGKNKYFELYLSDLGLEEIPEIPSSVEILYLNDNKIKTISNLPKNLRTLYISNNEIEEIKNLPSKIQKLYLNENQIKNVYNLPKNLIKLSLNYNGIRKLPELPENLTYLDVSYNKITELPSLKYGLELLYCHDNRLEELPHLPLSLKDLNCANNNLQKIPNLPKNIKLMAVNNPVFDKYYQVGVLNESNLRKHFYRNKSFDTLILRKGTVLFKSLKKPEFLKDAFVGYQFKDKYILSPDHESYFFLHPFNTSYGDHTAIFVLTQDVELILGLKPSKDYNKYDINERFGQKCKEKKHQSLIKNQYQSYCISDEFTEQYPNILGWIAPDDEEIPDKHKENKNFLKYYKYVTFYKNDEELIIRPEVSIYPLTKRMERDVITPVNDFDGDWIIKNQSNFNYKLVTILEDNVEFKDYKNLIDELLSKKGHKFGDETYRMTRSEVDGMYYMGTFGPR